jgi:hypothetical protein
MTVEIGDLAVLLLEGQLLGDIGDPAGKMGNCTVGAWADPRAIMSGKITAYPPQKSNASSVPWVSQSNFIVNARGPGDRTGPCRSSLCKLLLLPVIAGEACDFSRAPRSGTVSFREGLDSFMERRRPDRFWRKSDHL